MILNVLIAAGYAVAALVIVVGIPAVLLLFATGYRTRQRDIGYQYGHGDGALEGHAAGEAKGYARGYATAQLDAVLTEHYAGVVSALPDAYDSAAFWEAVHSEGLNGCAPEVRS